MHPTQPQPDGPVLDLPTLEGWKAELILVLVYLSADSRPSRIPGSNYVIATQLEVEQATLQL